LELFSDGVFAIVLTLLVLDLRIPAAHGLAGLVEIVPALLVHAATFFLVGSFWLVHHNGMARITKIRSNTLLLNLLSLFFVTLLPFGARNAAERPLEPLGASLMAAAAGLYLLSLLCLRLTAHSAIDDNPGLRLWRRFRIIMVSGLIAADLACAGLAWLSPWPAYAAILASAVFCLFIPAPPEVEQRIAAATAV
jgi:uncharacterized membrane protein